MNTTRQKNKFGSEPEQWQQIELFFAKGFNHDKKDFIVKRNSYKLSKENIIVSCQKIYDRDNENLLLKLIE